MNIQRFAEGDNNALGIKTYTLQFKELLQAVFKRKSYFGDFFAGGLEAIDGVTDSDTAFLLKTCDIPVISHEYNTDANVGMGTGTANSSRFGDITEIKYANTKAEYTWNWAFHEGLDKFTVNYPLDEAVADRLDLIAQEKISMFNQAHSKFISEKAYDALKTSAGGLTADDVRRIFNEAAAYFNNLEATGTRHAKVNSDFYNLIVDDALTVTGKNSSINIDENGIIKFKGFVIESVPDYLFENGEVAYFYIGGVAKAFTGIDIVRTVDAIDFAGVQLQGAGKAGEYISNDNTRAVLKVSLPAS